MNHYTPDDTLEKNMIKYAAAKSVPINGSFELLPLCNMNCKMCYVRLSRVEMEEKGRLRTADEWLSLAEQMQKAGTLFLLLTGGEPLMYPDFKKLYLGLKKLGVFITVNTNGTLLNEEWADFFAANKPRRINMTLYGADEKAYTDLCRYPGGFEKTMNALKLLKERNVPVKMNFSVTRANVSYLADIYRIGKELDVLVETDCYMMPALKERHLPISEQSRLAPEQAAAARLAIMRYDRTPEMACQYIDAVLNLIEENNNSYPDGVSCLAGNCGFTVNWRGEMKPCVTFDEPAVSVFYVGFEEAWRQISQKTKEFRLNPQCVSCNLRVVCPVCVATAKLETGSYNGVPEYLCRYAKETVHLFREEQKKYKNESGGKSTVPAKEDEQ